MPGDEWQRFANLRLLYTYMFTYPEKKLLFMGCEFTKALKSLGQDIRLVMPAYRQAKDQLTHIKKVAQITVQKNEVELLKETLPGTRLPIWLLENCLSSYDITF